MSMSCMNTRVRCKVCKGEAKVLGVGHIRRLCLACNGCGTIELKVDHTLEKPEYPGISSKKKKMTKEGRTKTPCTLPIKPEPTLETIKPFDTNSNVMINTNNTNSSGLL